VVVFVDEAPVLCEFPLPPPHAASSIAAATVTAAIAGRTAMRRNFE
jgi:hypothetical protein